MVVTLTGEYRNVSRHQEPIYFWFLYVFQLTVCMLLLVYALIGKKGITFVVEAHIFIDIQNFFLYYLSSIYTSIYKEASS
jgi:hypothetical protein